MFWGSFTLSGGTFGSPQKEMPTSYLPNDNYSLFILVVQKKYRQYIKKEKKERKNKTKQNKKQKTPVRTHLYQ